MAKDPVRAALANREHLKSPKPPRRPRPGSRAWYELELREEKARLADLETADADAATIETSRERVRALELDLSHW